MGQMGLKNLHRQIIVGVAVNLCRQECGGSHRAQGCISTSGKSAQTAPSAPTISDRDCAPKRSQDIPTKVFAKPSVLPIQIRVSWVPARLARTIENPE